jgi:predicted hotdog family 3-hydroxylacyl-ACP dehydratase
MTIMSDSTLFDYLPHRPPMLLLTRLLSVAKGEASAEVDIDATSSFYIEGKGVPAWIGVEYMGQTAALIAGYQQQHGQLTPHMGFLLGTRRYHAQQPWFTIGSRLRIDCVQAAVVGETLATFDCKITAETRELATAQLSVVRKQIVRKANTQ